MMKKTGDVGEPFNIASYAPLTMTAVQVTGPKAGDFVPALGGAHIDKNHFEQAKLQLGRTLKPLSTMRINPAVRDIFSFSYGDFELAGYEADSSMRALIAV